MRCAALDINGKRCGRKGVWWFSYHGDGELYHDYTETPAWVRIILCRKHGATLRTWDDRIKKKAKVRTSKQPTP